MEQPSVELSYDDLEQLLSTSDLEWLIQQKCKEEQLDASRTLLKARLEQSLDRLKQLEQDIKDEPTKEQRESLEKLRDAMAFRFEKNMHKLSEVMTELSNNQLEMQQRQRLIYDQLVQGSFSAEDEAGQS